MLLSALFIVGGLATAAIASRFAIGSAERLITASPLSPFVVGLLLLAIGTDLPEIANSIAASVGGFGDINAGDSVGSAFTQSTLVLGILALMAGVMLVNRRETTLIGTATVGSLLLGAALMADGFLSRWDGLLLIGAWVLVMVLAWRRLPGPALPPAGADPARVSDVAITLGLLFVVGAAAWVAVQGLVGLSAAIGISEYAAGFLVAAIGTSLPELIVNATALGRGAVQLAVGGLLGASLLDATVSIAAGPFIAPVAVTPEITVPASLFVAGALTLVTLLLVWRGQLGRTSALLLIGLYLLGIPVLISV